jgi:hypothetical protein
MIDRLRLIFRFRMGRSAQIEQIYADGHAAPCFGRRELSCTAPPRAVIEKTRTLWQSKAAHSLLEGGASR